MGQTSSTTNVDSTTAAYPTAQQRLEEKKFRGLKALIKDCKAATKLCRIMQPKAKHSLVWTVGNLEELLEFESGHEDSGGHLSEPSQLANRPPNRQKEKSKLELLAKVHVIKLPCQPYSAVNASPAKPPTTAIDLAESNLTPEVIAAVSEHLEVISVLSAVNFYRLLNYIRMNAINFGFALGAEASTTTLTTTTPSALTSLSTSASYPGCSASDTASTDVSFSNTPASSSTSVAIAEASASSTSTSAPVVQVSVSPERKEECGVCLDREVSGVLPCGHAFCLVCITQWNISSNTCPYCRTGFKDANRDTWDLLEIPSCEDLFSDIEAKVLKLDGRRRTTLDSILRRSSPRSPSASNPTTSPPTTSPLVNFIAELLAP